MVNDLLPMHAGNRHARAPFDAVDVPPRLVRLVQARSAEVQGLLEGHTPAEQAGGCIGVYL